MATIRKRGNKFQVQVRRAGFQSATKSFERLTEAKAWARQCEILFDQGEAGNQKPARIRLADVLRRIKDGARTAAYDLQIIRYALNIGCSEWGIYLKAKPVEHIRLPRPPKLRERRVTSDEYDSLLFHAKSSRSPFMYPLIILAVETGMRLGELLKLEWNDFDEEACLLTLKDVAISRPSLTLDKS